MAELERLELAVRQLPGRPGSDAGRGRPGGYGLDFHEYRPYLPGDDLRRVDWRRWARSGDLLLRTDLDRSAHPVHLLLDRSASMATGEPTKLSRALSTAAALAFAALRQGHPVGVVAFAGAEGAALPARPGLHWLEHVLNFLTAQRAQGETRLEAGLQAAVAGRRGQGRLVVISDLLDAEGPERAFDRLVGPGRAVDVVELYDPEDEALPLGVNLDAVDAETSYRRAFTVTEEVRSGYRDRLAAHRGRVRSACIERGFVHVLASVTLGPVEVARRLVHARRA